MRVWGNIAVSRSRSGTRISKIVATGEDEVCGREFSVLDVSLFDDPKDS